MKRLETSQMECLDVEVMHWGLDCWVIWFNLEISIWISKESKVTSSSVIRFGILVGMSSKTLKTSNMIIKSLTNNMNL